MHFVAYNIKVYLITLCHIRPNENKTDFKKSIPYVMVIGVQKGRFVLRSMVIKMKNYRVSTKKRSFSAKKCVNMNRFFGPVYISDPPLPARLPLKLSFFRLFSYYHTIKIKKINARFMLIIPWYFNIFFQKIILIIP